MEKEKQMETGRKAVAAFMAFGTKGDVYPIAAIAAAFAVGQERHRVVLMTHSAHENLASHLEERRVDFVAIKSPPALSVYENHDSAEELDFSLRKRIITAEHRRECYSAIEQIFGPGPSMEGDFILINFFALEGWSFAELFRVRCIVAAPYVVPYSAPSSFVDRFRKDLPLLYKHLRAAPSDMVCWKDVTHWMWPLFTENWGLWRSDDLNLSACPFTDPVTGLPAWHDWLPSPLLLYGFSKEIVECPDYWPSNVRVCGFWFLPTEWQFSCKKCGKISELSPQQNEKTKGDICSVHFKLHFFLRTPASVPPIFIGLSSAGSMGFLRNPHAFLQVLQTVLAITNYRFILFTAGYEPLDDAVKVSATETSCLSEREYTEEGIYLFDGHLFCFPGTSRTEWLKALITSFIHAAPKENPFLGASMMSYKWLFPRCAAAIHHGGSGSTAAALHAGIPQVLCPFMLDQFYWAEKMHWIGVAPEPLNSSHLLPDQLDDMSIKNAADTLSRAIKKALSPEVKARALEIAERISAEDGVSEAVKILKKEMNC